VLHLLGGDPPAAAQVLCSAVPDAAVQAVLGPFYAYTNPGGECHLDAAHLTGTQHAIQLTATLSAVPLSRYRSADGTAWRPLPAEPGSAGYLQVWTGVRWYRIGLSANPDAPGTLLISCRYIRFTRLHTTRTAPPPPQFWHATDGYVRQVAANLTR
jgi:hypothetical protein